MTNNDKCCEICEPFCYKNGVKCKCLCHQPTLPTKVAYTLSCPHGVAKEDCKKCMRGEKCELDNPNKCHHPERCVGECMQSEKPNVECTCDIKNGRHLLSCVHSTPPVQAQEEWEEEFDLNCACYQYGKNGLEVDFDFIKDFIRSLLLSDRTSLIKKLEGMKKEHCGQKDCGQGQCLQRATRNKALNSAISLLKDNK